MDYKKDYFKGKVSIVTGAASGIGYGLSEALFQAGAIVTMADWNAELLSESANRLSTFTARVKASGTDLSKKEEMQAYSSRTDGSKQIVVQPYTERLETSRVDVSKQEEVRALIENTVARHGRLDLLFNNAGVGWGGPIRTADLKAWRRIMDINLWGVIFGIDAALPVMSRQKSGHIINTASIFGLVPGVYESLYCTTKHAVVGLSEALRYELEADGINVSVICPGAVATRIFPEGGIPPDAISPAEAASVILEGVSRHKGIIVVNKNAVRLWKAFRCYPSAFEKFIRKWTIQHRSYYETVSS